MGAYDAYVDTNGIKWTIASSGRSMLATVLDDQQPRYIPNADDLVQPILTPGDGTQAEVERVAFVKLRDQIEAYAAAHRQNTGLTVSAHVDEGVPWWVWAAAGALLLSSRR